MKILAIETSCDETAIALIKGKGGLNPPTGGLHFKVLKNIVSSQIKIHRPYGGIVPMLAKREHIRNLPLLLEKIMANSSKSKINPPAGGQKSKTKAKNKKLNIDVIAVTVGPGLEPALWTGIEFTKDFAHKFKKPLIGVNHLEGHLYSYLLSAKKTLVFPAVALIASGGHTILLLMKSLTKWKKLGETRDDAAGEAFDKVGRLLNLPFPGGPEIEKLARKGNPQAINFPRPMLNQKNYEFSFSGLKTAVLYYLRDHFNLETSDVSNIAAANLMISDVQNIAASFQQAIIDVLVGKTIRAAREFKAKSILLCGGVAANKCLRENLKKKAENLNFSFFVPDFEYNTDNAAMIAAAAYIDFLQKNKKRLRIEAQANLTI